MSGINPIGEIAKGILVSCGWAGIGYLGAYTVIGLSFEGAALFCGLQPLLMKVGYVAVKSFQEQEELNDATSGVLIGGSVLASAAFTTKVMGYTLNPAGALALEILLIGTIALATLSIGFVKHQIDESGDVLTQLTESLEYVSPFF